MKFPIEMYRIRKEDMKIKVPCERCLEKGIVNKYCHRCGGNGTHNKTIKVWKVAPRTVTVEKIDRASKDSYYKGVQTSYVGGLRYWTGASEFFNEEDKYLHFNKNDAQEECDKRNVNIADILKIHKQEKQKMIKYFCDRCGKEIKGNVNEYTDTTEAINPHTQKVVATWKSVEHICDECEQKELTCGFKVGDKVITDDGRTGTIRSICYCDRCKERGFYEPKVVTDVDSDPIWITDTDKEDGFKSFYQIGDRVFGNLNEEPVITELEEIGERYNKLVKQQGMIHILRYKKENSNGN